MPTSQSFSNIIETLLDLQTPQAPNISPDGKRVVYSTGYYLGHKKTDESRKSSIWLADIGKENSARQLTSGLYNDQSPRWCLGNDAIVFTSDRKEVGKKSGVYQLALSGGGEPVLLTDNDYEMPIDSLTVSPNGKYAAFLRTDEKTPEQKQKEKDKDDPDVFGEHWDFNRLKLLHLQTRAVQTLVSGEYHINSFVWSQNSRSIAYQTQITPELEAPLRQEAELHRVDIASQKSSLVTKYNHFPAGPTMQWVDGRIYATVNALAGAAEASIVVASVPDEGGQWTVELGGESSCAVALASQSNVVIAKMQNDLKDELRTSSGKLIKSDLHEYRDFHVVADAEDSDKPTIALACSNINGPVEVYSLSSGASSFIKLSHHGAPITEDVAVPVPIHTKSVDDEVELDGLLLLPKTALPDAANSTAQKPVKPLPTFVYPHGGPYSRYTSYFMQGYGWPQVLLRQGYAVFCPNYRGGSSHGTSFAGPHVAGKYDWVDMMALTNYVVGQGYADKDNLLIGGWSQGGYLSYLAAVRNGTGPGKLRFRGAIAGAGVSDWDTMASTSDLPLFETELAGGAPWNNDKEFLVGRTGSALWEFKKAAEEKRIPPVLILHGDEDERTPVSQAMGFHRACRQWNLPCQLVVYPREGHGFKERRHIADMFERVIKFCDLHFS